MYEPPQSQPPPGQPYQPGPIQPPGPPPKKGGAGKVVGIILGVLALLVCCCIGGIVVAWNSDFGKSFREGITEELNSDPENAKVGDCLTRTVKEDASDAKVVACTDPLAENKVIGVITGVTEARFDAENQTLCDKDFPEWENVLWFGPRGGVGKVLCVAPN